MQANVANFRNSVVTTICAIVEEEQKCFRLDSFLFQGVQFFIACKVVMWKNKYVFSIDALKFIQEVILQKNGCLESREEC